MSGAGGPRVGLISLGVGLAAAGAGAAIGMAAERAALGRPLVPASVKREVTRRVRGAGAAPEGGGAQDADGAEPGPPPAPGSLRGRVETVTTEDGLALYVEVDDAAAGAPDVTVVFCHGYALTLDSWHYQRLAVRGRGLRAVFWDQRGHGRSAVGADRGVSIDQLGRDLAAVLDTVVPTGRVILVGHSMGGMTVMSLAQERPEYFAERVTGVALVATSAGGLGGIDLGLRGLGRMVLRIAPATVQALSRTPGLVERGRRLGSDLETVIVRRWSFDSKVPDELVQFAATMIASTRLEVISDFLPTFGSHDKREALAAMRGLEVLVLVGDGDLLTPADHSEEIAALLPGAEHVLVTDAGHLVMLEHPGVVNTHLLDLVDRALAADPTSPRPTPRGGRGGSRVRRVITPIPGPRRDGAA